MNRRGHLSSKIPNVKLRPARGGSTLKRKEPSPMNESDEDEILRSAWQGAEDETASMGKGSRRPWESVILTFTGVENKGDLAKMAKQLGAHTESALTVNVTHVVASGFASAKYLYAVEHRIPVMRPEWIEETHAMYLAGEEFDLKESMKDMKLLPFTGLNIAMSGIEPIERRRQVVHYITTNGGQYSKDLDGNCTHLISAKMTTERNVSEKVKWAMAELAAAEADRRKGKKVEHTELWIVFEEWIWDCVGYEGRWKEDMYDARKVRRTPRCHAEDVLEGRLARAITPPPVVKVVKEDAAVLKRRKKEAYDQVIADLVNTTATADAPRGPSDASASNADKPGRRKTEIEERKSLLHTSRGGSFAAPAVPGSSTGTGTLAAAKAGSGKTKGVQSVEPVQEEAEKDSKDYPQIYAGSTIVPYISSDTSSGNLESALRKHGAKVLSTEDWQDGAKADYMIVRLRRPDFSNVPVDQRPMLVTECWVEGCCYEQRLIPPTEQLVFRPLQVDLPIPGSEKAIVHVTGFSVETGVYMKRLVKALGMAWSLKLHKQTTHLIAAQPKGQKYDKALEWGVDVVRDTWLYRAAETGRMDGVEDHRHPNQVSLEPAEAVPGGMDIDDPPAPATNADLDAQTSSVVTPAIASIAPTTHATQIKKERESQRAVEEGEKENVDTSMSRSASRSATSAGTEAERVTSRSQSQSQKGGRGRDGKTPTADPTNAALVNVLSPPRNATQRRLNGADRDVKAEETQTVAKEEPQSLPSRNTAQPVAASVPSSNLKTSVSALQKLGLESPSRAIGRTASAPDESPSLTRRKERATRGKEPAEMARSASVSAVPATSTGPQGTGSSAGGLGASSKVSEVSDIMRLLVDPDESMVAAEKGQEAAGKAKPSSAAVNNAINKMVRRGRPSTRLRTSTSGAISTPRSSTHIGDVSGDTTMDTTHMFTPSPTGSRASRSEWGGGGGRETSGTPGLGEDYDMEGGEREGAKSGAGPILAGTARGPGMGTGMGMGTGLDPLEESVRVDYVDPAGEKERRRMFEQYRRLERERARKARMEGA